MHTLIYAMLNRAANRVACAILAQRQGEAEPTNVEVPLQMLLWLYTGGQQYTALEGA